MKSKVSKMTLDKLAEITQSEFSHINKRLDRNDDKFESIFSEIRGIHEEMRELKRDNQNILNAVKVIIEHTTNDLRSRLDSFDHRLSVIEKSKK